MSRITLQELPCPSALLPRLDHREADAEFLRCAAAADGTFYAVRAGGEAVGLAQAEPGWLYLYIFPEHRRRGYASGAVPLLERLPRMAEEAELSTCWNSAAGTALAASCGYRKKFSSDCMVYSGSPFPSEDLPIRGYRDAGDVSGYAREAMSWALSEGILQGTRDGTLQPQSRAARGQTAVLLERFQALLKNP